MVLGTILLKNASSIPARPAIVCKSSNQTSTYGELNATVNRLAQALMGAGVNKGDRVSIVQPNSLQYIEVFFAVMKAGAVFVPLDYRLTPKEQVFLLKDSGASTLVLGENYLSLADIARAEVGSVKNFIHLGAGDKHIPGYDELVSQYPPIEPVIDVNESDLAMLLYTSGTTGSPKGVMMTHKNLVAAMMNIMKALPVTADDVTLHTSPFSHIAAVWPLLTHCYAGGANVILERFIPEAVVEAIQENGVTTWNSVPTMILRLVEYLQLQKSELPSLRWVGYGASPMPTNVLRQAIHLLGNIFVQVYGTTETYIATALPQEDHVLDGPEEKVKRLGSCGRPISGCEVRVVSDQGQDVVPGEVGEIIVKGDSVTHGYWNLPKETAKSIRQGWFYTGDLATVDDQGYIYIIDRKKEIIISGGENIAPKEIENVIYGHPVVFEVAVIGIPDEKWGEAVKAIVVLRQSKKATEEEIISYCRQNLARFKVPKSVEFTNSLPKTASGKIARKELKEQYRLSTA